MAPYKKTKLEKNSKTTNFDSSLIKSDQNTYSQNTSNLNDNESESAKTTNISNNIKSTLQLSVSDKIKNGISNLMKKKQKPIVLEEYKVKPAVK